MKANELILLLFCASVRGDLLPPSVTGALGAVLTWHFFF